MSSKAVLLALLATIFTADRAEAAFCSVSVTPLVFGTYQTTSNAPVNIAATVGVTCSAATASTVSYEIRLATGKSGSFINRTMSSGDGQLAYQLYSSPAMGQIWGDGTGGTAVVQGSLSLTTGASRTATYTVYGRAAARQNVSPGTYQDPITVLLVVN